MAGGLCRLLKQKYNIFYKIPFYHSPSTAVIFGKASYCTNSTDDWRYKKDIDDPAFKQLDLSFENAKEAYKSKTTFDLIRAWMVFELCSIEFLVNNNKKLMKVGRKVLGKKLFKAFMKGSFYGHFVAGENEKTIKSVIEKNKLFGVKSILDYSVEKDISKEQATKQEEESCVSENQPENITHTGPNVQYRYHTQFADRREEVIAARTHFYEDEKSCDDIMKIFLREIDGVSGSTNATGFAAIKLTALGRPQFLLQLSEVLERVRRYYDVIAATIPAGEFDVVPAIKRREFERHLKTRKIKRSERQLWYTILDSSGDGEIDMLDWHNLLEVNVRLGNLLKTPNAETGVFEPIVTSFTVSEEMQMKNMLKRINTIVEYAIKKDVRLMIDAEQTYFQNGINRLCMEMMRKFNKEKAYVFNTYQCYLKESLSTLRTDLALAERENFFFGAKIVRGAYMEQERKRALTLGYEDPINVDYEATTKMYEDVLCEILFQAKRLDKGRIAVMVATHNEDSVRYTVKKMKEFGISSSDKIVCFGQLYGMCDQVSFSLGQAGYSVYKYVPYGPVEEVLPYLSRRALENKGILKKVKKEKRLLREETWRRFISGQLLYSPQGATVST
ncbi:DgyrCDS9537 [Dimorphilus gyrociliatus]|uniref:Proline dehydrogenase n=1 Tax=Dimorphilus gyrociliatus TaxID=2664684 RepID=A0A7I8VXM9_9ANNE|nr:DgyrCDS9537 [Dimorphilus gyrociliatus]